MLRGLLYLGYVACVLIYNDVRLTLSLSWRRDRRTAAHRYMLRQARRILRTARYLTGMQVTIEEAATSAPLPQRFILITNHQSLADIPLLLSAFPRQELKFVAKTELSHGVPSVSKCLRYAEHGLIDRHGPFRASQRALLGLAALVEQGCSVSLFPEGTRSRNGRLGRFHSAGLRVLAEHTSAPFVIAALDGGWRMSGLAAFRNMSRTAYRLRVLDVQPHIFEKRAIAALLTWSRSAITRQLDLWRTQTEEGGRNVRR